METYRADECAIIFKTRERHGVGSNMRGGMPITHQGIVFESSEVLYQAARFHGNLDRKVGSKTVLEHINLPSAMTAKKATRPLLHLTRPDWDNVKVGVMETCLRLKLLQHTTEVLEFLEETKDMPIVEKSYGDDFWGAKPDRRGNLKGHNVLGTLWMLIREEYRRGILSDIKPIDFGLLAA